MDKQQFGDSAMVVDRDGIEIGRLVTIEEEGVGSLVVARTEDGRDIGIPYEQVDPAASTPDRVVVGATAASLDVGVGPEPVHEGTLTLSEEEMRVSTSWAEQGRVVIRKRVETVPQEKTVELAREGVEIERRPVNEVISELPTVRTEGETTIIPVVEEVLVVEKRYRLVEEVHVTSTRTTEQHIIRDDLRREVVDFEEVPTEDANH